ncbi:hypothetical protein ACFWAR_01580 [Streptomyces sp. NPDC059917]|uniref:hypothetical protein n=1 Tax=Streptomyces sp. NPDC059917 TaxID=3347002 RepID=UPI003656E9E5
MQNLGLEQRGHVLLIAGGPAVHRRTVQVAPSANLAALGVVPASALLNSGLSCDTTYLDGARDPNLVLTRLRTAAATRGPLLVYLSGRLTVDRRSRRLHLALATTTAGSVRYTALPWEWLGAELRHRPAGSTTLLLDLVADKTAWPLLQEYGSLPVTPSAEVYGVVSPPGFAGSGNTVSSYTRCWIDQLASSPGRPANLQLHALALGAAALAPGTVVLPTARELAAPAAAADPLAAAAPAAPAAQAPPHDPAYDRAPGPEDVEDDAEPGHDPRPHIHALATAGRHTEAAALALAWEEYVVRRTGHGSPEATRWLEIRADLARMAGTFGTATRLWTSAGQIRLARQSPDAPEVHAAAAGALYCWTQLRDQETALDTAPELIRFLRALRSFDSRHIEMAQQRLEYLHRTPSRS